MKTKTIIVSLFLILLCSGCARYRIYSVSERPKSATGGGVVYSLPQTRLIIDVLFLKIDRSQAEYADYAEEFLGYQDKPEIFSIQNVTISSAVEADTRHTYYVVPHGTAVQVGQNHLLRSVGLPYREGANEVSTTASSSSVSTNVPMLQNQTYDRVDTLYAKGDKPGKPTYISTRQDVKSVRRRAKEAAASLKQIQERREELLSGETSLSGEALKVALDQLQQTQQAISQQFLGVPHTESVRFSVVPRVLAKGQTEEEWTLFWFHPQLGLVDSTYADAYEVRCKAQNLNSMRDASRFLNYRTEGTSNRKNVRKNHFKYRMAEQTMVSVYCPIFNFQQVLPVAQYGPMVDLPRSARNKAIFDSNTGDLIYYGE